MLQHSVSTLTTAFEFTSPGSGVSVGPLNLRWYGLLIASAVLIGLALSQRLAKARQLSPDLVGDLLVWLIVGAIPGARLYYVLFQWNYYSQHPGQILAIWRGGIAIHGAILGGMLAAALFSRVKHCSFWRLADVVAPSLILGQAIGRWGNFFNSEAFGSPTDLPWKLFIPPDRRLPGFESVAYYHPTFLYESLWNLMVFGLLMALFIRFPQAKRGTLFLVYAIAYSCGRFWIEGLRTDSLMFGPLRMAQMVSLVGVIFGSAGLIWLYLLRRSLPDNVPKQTSLGS
ncbi:prolipoprotein diacylglyceryl transferase [Altericista sp. CCNU0014]|uniref:prolipoprotein diacylglyceryl transferase n=1 Tax=Altericista sp. CCNU0014 TaxID=3082949 RepID=UPI00384DE57B